MNELHRGTMSIDAFFSSNKEITTLPTADSWYSAAANVQIYSPVGTF